MKVEQLVEKVRTESEFSLQPTNIEFLNKLEKAHPASIAKIDALIHRYDAQGIKIYKHLDFLFEILRHQLNLPADMERTLSEFLASDPLDYTQMIQASYAERWGKIARQASAQVLTYHTSYHALEVALRTNIGAKNLGIFVEKNEKNQFLQYLLLTAAKYHDYEQWERGHPVTNDGFHTPEEQTAAMVVDWLISDLHLTEPDNPIHESMKLLLYYFVKLTIGPGTTILFGNDRLVNLSTIYYELEDIVHDAGLFENLANRSLVYSIQAATEVLGAMDKVSAASLDVACYQSSDEEECTSGYIRQLAMHKSHLIDFFVSIPPAQQYYPGISWIANFETGAIMNVAHTEMEIELHRDSAKAIFLRDYIKKGQEIHKTSDQKSYQLASYLHQVLTDERVADAFRHIYLAAIAAEQSFAGKLPDICQHINLKLHQLGYVNESGESCYAAGGDGSKEGSQPTGSLELPPPDVARSMSDFIPSLVHPFLDPRVFEKEVHILGALEDHIYHLDEIKQREIIQEILIVSICQPGIRYSNHPDLIHKVESPSPINCKTPLEIMGARSRSNTSLARSRYSSFSLNESNQRTSEGTEGLVLVGEFDMNTSHPTLSESSRSCKK